MEIIFPPFLIPYYSFISYIFIERHIEIEMMFFNILCKI